MAHSEYTCNCDVIHEDVVNEVRNKLQTKEDYIPACVPVQAVW